MLCPPTPRLLFWSRESKVSDEIFETEPGCFEAPPSDLITACIGEELSIRRRRHIDCGNYCVDQISLSHQHQRSSLFFGTSNSEFADMPHQVPGIDCWWIRCPVGQFYSWVCILLVGGAVQKSVVLFGQRREGVIVIVECQNLVWSGSKRNKMIQIQQMIIPLQSYRYSDGSNRHR